MKIYSIYIIAIVMLLPGIISAENSGLLYYVDKESIKLTDRQKELLERFGEKPQTKEIYIVKVNKKKLKEKSDKVNLPEETLFLDRKENLSDKKESSYSFNVADKPYATVIFTLHGENVSAQIQTREFLYTIRTLTGAFMHSLKQTRPSCPLRLLLLSLKILTTIAIRAQSILFLPLRQTAHP